MARDFLLGSKTYKEKVPLKIQLRRHLICGCLDGLYEMPRGKGNDIAVFVTTISGVNTAAEIVWREVKIYRNAFAYLNGDFEKKEEFRKRLEGFNSKHATRDIFGVWCLVTDGIETMGELLKEEIERGESTLRKILEGEELKRAEERLREEGTEEIQESKEPEEQGIPLPLKSSPLIPREILDMMTAIRSGYEAALARQKELELALAVKEQESGILRGENEYLRLHNQKLRGEMERIKEMRLEELVELFPQSTRLYRLVQELEEKTREEGRYEKMLPRITQWDEGELLIEYLPRFREQFRAFAAREQGQIVTAIQRLTSSPEACFNSGFDTQKMRKSYPGTPDEFLKSRASRELRLGWRKEGPVIYFYIAFRKGDKDYVESET